MDELKYTYICVYGLVFGEFVVVTGFGSVCGQQPKELKKGEKTNLITIKLKMDSPLTTPTRIRMEIKTRKIMA